jgi:molybdopterin synthase catalytic subunit
MAVRVQTDDFEIAEEFERMRSRCDGVGAVVSFVGLVRDIGDGSHPHALTLDHHPATTQRTLAEIVAEAMQRWPVVDVEVIHRVGALDPADQVVLVLVAGAHRREAFAACEYVVDELKARMPFCKQEHDGVDERRVAPRKGGDATPVRPMFRESRRR